MLVCGEDLGMIPACVHPVMGELGLIGGWAARQLGTCWELEVVGVGGLARPGMVGLGAGPHCEWVEHRRLLPFCFSQLVEWFARRTWDGPHPRAPDDGQARPHRWVGRGGGWGPS